MLGDDIMEGTRKGVGIVAHAAVNVLKGALLFAAVVGGAYLLGEFGAAAIDLKLGALLDGAVDLFKSAEVRTKFFEFAGNALYNAGGYALTAGIIGGAVTGVASLLPGSDEGFSFGRMFKKLGNIGKAKHKEQVLQQEAQHMQPMPAARAERGTNTQTIIREVPSSAQCQPHQTFIDNSTRTQNVHTDAPTLNVHATTQQAAYNAPATTTEQPAQQDALPLSPDNPYFKPGKGTQLMQRGDAMAENTLTK